MIPINRTCKMPCGKMVAPGVQHNQTVAQKQSSELRGGWWSMMEKYGACKVPLAGVRLVGYLCGS